MINNEREYSTKNLSASSSDNTETEPVITVHGLKKVYGNGDSAIKAVNNVNFEIEQGTAVGVLGPNGAGKTTVIKSILSLIIPTEGEIRVGGVNVQDETNVAYQNMSAMLEGARNTYWRLTVRENLEIFSTISGRNYREISGEIDSMIEQFNLTKKADTVVRELSRGQKQKVSLACTMIRNTDVVFLDEPTLGLDVEASQRLRSELRKLVEANGRTVLLSSHDMDTIQEVCDRVIIMNEGRIVADDTIGNLIELFNTRAFKISVSGQSELNIEQHLKSEFVIRNIKSNHDVTNFEVEVTSNEFYDLVNTLERAGVTIESFTECEPDLDDIFIHITNEDVDIQRSTTVGVGER